MNAKERIKEIDRRMCNIKNEMAELRRERENLSAQYKGWFIGNQFIGDGDYWDEWLMPLGFITEEEATAWVNENNDYCSLDMWMGVMPPFYEVTKEDYQLYFDWWRLQQALDKVRCCKNCDDICSAIYAAIADLKQRLLKEKAEYNFIHILGDD